MKETEILLNGLYVIRDEYFARFQNGRLTDNKGEARPNYYAVKDVGGIFWMIPLSTQTKHYKEKVAAYEAKYGAGRCLFYEFANIGSVERVVLVGNMFPVTSEYIERQYTIAGNKYILKDRNAIARIRKKASRYLSLINRGIIDSPAKILQIRDELLKSRTYELL